jgi:hypothetical protein
VYSVSVIFIAVGQLPSSTEDNMLTHVALLYFTCSTQQGVGTPIRSQRKAHRVAWKHHVALKHRVLHSIAACRNGATQWHFPGVAYNNDDVTIQKTDVTAGSAVIHFVDYNVFSPAQRTFWAQQAKNMRCGEGGGPAVTNAKGVDQQQQQQQQQPQAVNAGMIAGGVRPRAVLAGVCQCAACLLIA